MEDYRLDRWGRVGGEWRSIGAGEGRGNLSNDLLANGASSQLQPPLSRLPRNFRNFLGVAAWRGHELRLIFVVFTHSLRPNYCTYTIHFLIEFRLECLIYVETNAISLKRLKRSNEAFQNARNEDRISQGKFSDLEKIQWSNTPKKIT